jgi:hypothetical protein
MAQVGVERSAHRVVAMVAAREGCLPVKGDRRHIGVETEPRRSATGSAQTITWM